MSDEGPRRGAGRLAAALVPRGTAPKIVGVPSEPALQAQVQAVDPEIVRGEGELRLG